MMSTVRLALLFAAAVIIAGAAQAVEGAQVAANDSARPARRHAPPRHEEAQDDTAMQAICREILVDTDEGYGVTNRESRVICDELR